MQSALPQVTESSFAVGESFTREIYVDAETIKSFADLIGDTNPLHHDEAKAAQFGQPALMASGMHSSSLLMGMVADYMMRRGRCVGLDIAVKFLKPVLAGSKLRAEWVVTHVEAKPGLDRYIVQWSGQLFGPGDAIMITGTTTTLAFR